MCPWLKSGTPLVPSTSPVRSSAGPGCAAFNVLAGLSKEFKALAHGNAEDSGGKFRHDLLLPFLALLNSPNTFWWGEPASSWKKKLSSWVARPKAFFLKKESIRDPTAERVGGTDPISVDIRLVAATNRNLEEMVQGKQFREDLWFRLNVFPIRISPPEGAERGHFCLGASLRGTEGPGIETSHPPSAGPRGH